MDFNITEAFNQLENIQRFSLFLVHFHKSRQKQRKDSVNHHTESFLYFIYRTIPAEHHSPGGFPLHTATVSSGRFLYAPAAN